MQMLLMQMWLRPKAPTTLAKQGSSLWLVIDIRKNQLSSSFLTTTTFSIWSRLPQDRLYLIQRSISSSTFDMTMIICIWYNGRFGHPPRPLTSSTSWSSVVLAPWLLGHLYWYNGLHSLSLLLTPGLWYNGPCPSRPPHPARSLSTQCQNLPGLFVLIQQPLVCSTAPPFTSSRLTLALLICHLTSAVTFFSFLSHSVLTMLRLHRLWLGCPLYSIQGYLAWLSTILASWLLVLCHRLQFLWHWLHLPRHQHLLPQHLLLLPQHWLFWLQLHFMRWSLACRFLRVLLVIFDTPTGILVSLWSIVLVASTDVSFWRHFSTSDIALNTWARFRVVHSPA